jgi:tetratricopeptide (TPR) repeat protein
MRVNRLFIILVIPLMFLPAAAFSQAETGGVENIFSYGAGLRALGMGGAFTAMREDATLAYWNPGAMAFNQYKEVSVFGTRTIADSYYFAGFYTHPTVNFGVLSIGGLGLYTGGIKTYDEEAFPISGVSTDYFHYQVLLSYGYNFPFGLGVGGTAKLEQVTITEYTGAGGSFDLGVYYAPPTIPWLAVGAVVQDVIGTGIQLVSEVEQNTRIYKIGAATLFPIGETTRLAVALDSRFYWDNYNPETPQFLYDFSIGTEVTFNDFIMVRAGYRGFSFDSIFQNLPAGLSVGFGIRQWGVTLDYTVSFEDSTWQGAAELLMQLGISYRFGKSVDEQKQVQAEQVKKQIDEEIRKSTERYEAELRELSTQYESEKESIVREMDKQYAEKVSALDEIVEERRQEIIADLTAQFEAERERAIQDLSNEFDRERTGLERKLIDDRSSYEQRIENMESQFEQEKVEIRRKLEADEGFKSERYSRGLQLFADGEYQEALAEFETVAEYDEEYLNVQYYIQRSKAEMKDVSSYSPQILDIYYRGIDLFVQKKYEEAIVEWRKILQIDPYNKLAIRNIKEAEDRLRKLKELGAGQ